VRTSNRHSRRERLARGDQLPSKLPTEFPHKLLALCSAKDFDQFVNAAFHLLQTTVVCDWVSVLYPSIGTRMVIERDSRGRTYDAAFTRRHHELTPAARLAAATPGIKILPTRTGLPLSDDELHQTDYYREVMAVQGWRHAVALCFWHDPPAHLPAVVFGIQRQEGRVDFSDSDLETLEMTHAFMEPAVLRFCERAMARARSDALVALVRDTSPAVALVNSTMHLICVNRGAAALFRKKRSLRAVVLQQCRTMNEERIDMLQADSAADVRTHRCERAIADSAGEIRITMFCHDAEGLSDPTFLVEIDAAERTNSGHFTKALNDLAGLTAAEQNVVMALAGGRSNQEIADHLGKSVQAVKFLLHRIYTKTGIPNRTALVAALQAVRRSTKRRSLCK
jgi:DNA-binding CsgD family transcriptional regulator